MTFVKPPKITTDLPRTDPFMSDDWKFWTKRFWRCLFTTCDAKEWEGPIKEVLTWYNKILIKKNNKLFLKKGTTLYHGSTTYPFLGGQSDTNRMTFFGLDAIISIWYVLEGYLLQNDRKCFKQKSLQVSRYGYLYEFKLKNDLEVTKIIKLLVSNPKNDASCKKRNAVCLHPQVSFHGVESKYRKLPNYFDLCNELSLHYEVYKDILGKPNKIYMIDPILLYQNRNNEQFDPMDSIISSRGVQKRVDMTCPNYKQKTGL